MPAVLSKPSQSDPGAVSKEAVLAAVLFLWEQRMKPKNCWIVLVLSWKLGGRRIGDIESICREREDLEVHQEPLKAVFRFWVGPKGESFVELRDDEKISKEKAQRVFEKLEQNVPRELWTDKRLSFARELKKAFEDELGCETLGAVHAMLEDWVAEKKVGQKRRLIPPWELQPAPAQPVKCEKLGGQLRELLEKNHDVKLCRVKKLCKEQHQSQLREEDYGFQQLLPLMEHLEELGYLQVTGKGTTCQGLAPLYSPTPESTPPSTPRAMPPGQPVASPTPAFSSQAWPWPPQTNYYLYSVQHYQCSAPLVPAPYVWQ